MEEIRQLVGCIPLPAIGPGPRRWLARHPPSTADANDRHDCINPYASRSRLFLLVSALGRRPWRSHTHLHRGENARSVRLSALNGLAAPGGRKKGAFAATRAPSRNVPAVTASLISEQISIDFVHEGTGKLIFRRQYSRELVERVCKERDLTEWEWLRGRWAKL